MTVHKLLVNDQNNTFNDIAVAFTTEVPPSVVCALCGNISSDLLKVSCGRSYCPSCANMLTKDDDEIECEYAACTHKITETTTCNEGFLQALRLPAMCPTQGCSFHGSLREVMAHYGKCKPSGPSVATCSLCGQSVSTKQMPYHVAELCECRPLSCPYCEVEVEARNIEIHMEDCDYRPATCTHCKAEFDTFVELRDRHMDVCPQKPVKCPYHRFGCNDQVPKRDMENHLRLPSHVSLFVDRILKLEAEVQELRNENNTLKDTVRQVEDKQNVQEYQLTNMADSQEDAMEKISELRAEAMQTQPEVDARIKELENMNAMFKEPLDKLFKELAALK